MISVSSVSIRAIRGRLYSFPRILHILPQHSTEIHLYILDEGVMPIIIAVQPQLIRINHVVIIPHRHLLITHLVQFLFGNSISRKL